MLRGGGLRRIIAGGGMILVGRGILDFARPFVRQKAYRAIGWSWFIQTGTSRMP